MTLALGGAGHVWTNLFFGEGDLLRNAEIEITAGRKGMGGRGEEKLGVSYSKITRFLKGDVGGGC